MGFSDLFGGGEGGGGGTLGSLLGAGLGSLIAPGVGTMIGGQLGGMAGGLYDQSQIEQPSLQDMMMGMNPNMMVAMGQGGSIPRMAGLKGMADNYEAADRQRAGGSAGSMMGGGGMDMQQLQDLIRQLQGGGGGGITPQIAGQARKNALAPAGGMGQAVSKGFGNDMAGLGAILY